MGVWGRPRRLPVALKALPEPWRLGRSGDRGAKTRKGFEAAKEQWIDNPLEIACNVLWIVLPAAGSLNPAALNDTKAVFECLFVVGYGAFPTKLFIQPVCF